METYYYDIRKQVFEYDEVMNNQRRAVYAERRRVLEGRELKQQVIGYGERTMDDIVDAYVNPELPPEEWDLARLVEVAALDQKLKGMGRNSAQEFNERLLELMQQKGSST